jgi:aspartate aminotransferase-like enzyme
MTPGPTRVPERVLAAGARPMIHHRTGAFSNELAEMVRLMAPLVGTSRRVLPLPSTGRGGMEAAICNFFSPGDEIVVCANGRFGALWGKIAETFGLVVHRVSTDWTRDVDAAEVDGALARHPRTRAVALTYSDTSTGVANDVAAVARVASARGALVLVDAVSAIGGMPFAFDDWGVDVVVTASQKCLMSSPGLALVVVSDRAWAATRSARLPRHYWDLVEADQAMSKPRPLAPGTTAVHVVLQVTEALRMIHEEGLEHVCRRHAQMSNRLRQGLSDLGLALQCPKLQRESTTLTAVLAPAGLAPKAIRDGLEARGILVAEGLGPYDATAFRIGHMGDIRMADIERTLTALGDLLPHVQA